MCSSRDRHGAHGNLMMLQTDPEEELFAQTSQAQERIPWNRSNVLRSTAPNVFGENFPNLAALKHRILGERGLED